MQNLKSFSVFAAVLVAVFLAAYFFGKCSGRGKCPDCPVPKADTVYISQTDTFFLEPGRPRPQTGRQKDIVGTDKVKDSIIHALTLELEYYEALTEYQKNRIAAVEATVPPAIVDSQPPLNSYPGDTTTPKGTRLSWDIKVRGFLDGKPRFEITNESREIVNTVDRTKNRGIGFRANIYVDSSGTWDYPIEVFYESDWKSIGLEYHPRMQGVQIGAGVKFGWRKEKDKREPTGAKYNLNDNWLPPKRDTMLTRD